jgi:hypothetical protein
VPRRRYSLEQQGFTSEQPHSQTFDQPPRNTFDSDSRGSFDSYAPAASPYASRLETGSSSGPISSAGSPYTGAGPTPTTLSTPTTFGHNPSPPTFGGHQQLHASPASYAPSPLSNPSTHNFYIPNGYDPQYGGHGGLELGMDDGGGAGVDPPMYEKAHQMMYEVKAPDGHHLGGGEFSAEQQGRVPVHHHGISAMAMAPPQTWSHENGPAGHGEYWWRS